MQTVTIWQDNDNNKTTIINKTGHVERLTEGGVQGPVNASEWMVEPGSSWQVCLESSRRHERKLFLGPYHANELTGINSSQIER